MVVNAPERPTEAEVESNPLAIKMWQRNAAPLRRLAEQTGMTPNFLANQLLADLLQSPPEWVEARISRNS